MADLTDRVAASRAACGLPAKVEDSQVLARVAALLLTPASHPTPGRSRPRGRAAA